MERIEVSTRLVHALHVLACMLTMFCVFWQCACDIVCVAFCVSRVLANTFQCFPASMPPVVSTTFTESILTYFVLWAKCMLQLRFVFLLAWATTFHVLHAYQQGIVLFVSA